MHINKTASIIENSTAHLAFGAAGEIEAYFDVTPFDDLIEKEEKDDLATLINSAQTEAVRRLLIFVFGNAKTPLEALQKLHLVTYCIAPSLLGDKDDLASIAKGYDSSKQCFSKRLLKLNKELKVRSRNQKSNSANTTYSNKAKAWHKANKAKKAAKKEDV